MPTWLIRLLALAIAVLAAVGTLLGLVPFTETTGLILLFVALGGGVTLILLGRRKPMEQWPRAARFFSWWALGLSVIAIVTVLVISGSLSSCSREIERTAESYQSGADTVEDSSN